MRRFCTESLKLRPIKKFLEQVEEERGPLVNAVGVRADESASRARMSEWEWWGELDAEIWRPLLAATYDDIVEIHRRHNMPPNPLYLEGARRVGCHPCIFSAKHDIRQIAPDQLVKIRRVEQDLTSDAVARGRERPTRAFFQVRGPAGLAFTPIDEVFEQAHTVRGRAWEPAADPPGCRRWGLCEAGEAPSEAAAPIAYIGHDHALALGIPPELLTRWLNERLLLPAHGGARDWAGFYQRTPAVEAELAAQLERIPITRQQLLARGITAAQITRWRNGRGPLRRTTTRGLYEITRAALAKLSASPTDQQPTNNLPQETPTWPNQPPSASPPPPRSTDRDSSPSPAKPCKPPPPAVSTAPRSPTEAASPATFLAFSQAAPTPPSPSAPPPTTPATCSASTSAQPSAASTASPDPKPSPSPPERSSASSPRPPPSSCSSSTSSPKPTKPPASTAPLRPSSAPASPVTPASPPPASRTSTSSGPPLHMS
ncbi:MAG: phosphoadenosine phosphosulfate reductase family protein [Nannocystis sp.]|nr:phosphoadenosine phosphosulfate reductase family protein [Nannocystis sp.]